MPSADQGRAGRTAGRESDPSRRGPADRLRGASTLGRNELLEPNVPLHHLAGDVFHGLVGCPGGVSQQGERRVERAVRLHGHHALGLRDTRHRCRSPRCGSVVCVRPHPIDRTRDAICAIRQLPCEADGSDAGPRSGRLRGVAGSRSDGAPIRVLPGLRREGCAVQRVQCSYGRAHAEVPGPERAADHSSNPLPAVR